MAEYELVEDHSGFLGKGTFGVVDKVTRKSDGQESHLLTKTPRTATDQDGTQVFACKTIRFTSDKKHRAPAEREYSILSSLNHPNIVKYIDIRWAPTSAKIYMEFCEGGSLADFISYRAKTAGWVIHLNSDTDGN